MLFRIKVGALLVLAVAIMVLTIGWGGGGERYLISGSSTVAPILAEAAARLEEKNGGLKIHVQTGGSTRGIVDTRDGRNSAVMASRYLSSEEAAAGLIAYTKRNDTLLPNHSDLTAHIESIVVQWVLKRKLNLDKRNRVMALIE